ncbi:Xaa-Pro dipeptidyl-peptidase [Allokutzneria sp. NRRL B-24872]|uniref:Xaa-Pro dipeptidyl-peptidase n=1 Tax=Allokutzneria sp. NRRL B-24872 TaxID=1137961 RepID=UPI000A3C85EA|nr:Xaa-Pro dipeptidyl-peptidase [Allokutzneria sp. NRRL B-24872]
MRHLRRSIALLTGLAAAAAATLAGVPALAQPASNVVDNETKPIYSYAEAIRETVHIESKIDSDSDGKPDRITADVMRPKETNSGLKSATVMEASPYYSAAAAARARGGDENFLPGAAPRGFGRWYDEFFVPRGYAVVEVEMQGTARSQGCPTTGDSEDTSSIEASVDWLNGRAKAFYADGKPAVASWSTGAVGMLGVSYNGTLPNALAARGVDGLKTIVPIAAISSWYDYTRDQGIGYQGAWGNRYPEWLANYVISPAAKAKCAAFVKSLGDRANDDTYDYTKFWAERDYRPDAAKVKASVFVVHGQEDWNVKPGHFSKWWYELQKLDVPRKIWLHRGAHSDPIGIRKAEWEGVMHRWMDHWLLGLQNGVMAEPMADIQRPDGAWETHASWPDAAAKKAKLFLGAGGQGEPGALKPQPVADPAKQVITDLKTQSESAAAGDPELAKANRLAYLTAPLLEAVRLSGTASVSVNASADTTSAPLTALLVDYGQATRTEALGKSPIELMTDSCEQADLRRRTGCAAPPVEVTAATPYKVITRGSIDMKNHQSLSQGQDLVPGRTYNVTWELHPKDYVFPAGHRIGLVLVQNLPSYITPDAKANKVEITLAPSSLELPIVGGVRSIKF